MDLHVGPDTRGLLVIIKQVQNHRGLFTTSDADISAAEVFYFEGNTRTCGILGADIFPFIQHLVVIPVNKPD